jgi:hypothetical protein
LPTHTRVPTRTPIPPTPTPTPGPSPTPILPPIAGFAGIWRSSNPESAPKIVLASDGQTLFANVRYACELPAYWTWPKDCELGQAEAAYSGNPVLMVIDYESEIYTFTLTLNGDALHVTTVTDYLDNSTQADGTVDADYSKEVHALATKDQIIFFRFLAGAAHGLVGAVRTPLFLAPSATDLPYTADTAADLRAALELVLADQSNQWTSPDLAIVEITFGEGHAAIVLQGELLGADDDVLTAARAQFLLTVFTNPAVQTAAVTLNGDTLANLGLANGAPAMPADYVFMRAEMETYLNEHYYSFEWGEFLDRNSGK